MDRVNGSLEALAPGLPQISVNSRLPFLLKYVDDGGLALSDLTESNAGTLQHVLADPDTARSQPEISEITNSELEVFEPHIARDRDWVIAKIESVFEAIADDLLEDRDKVSIVLRSRGGLNCQRFDRQSRSIRPTISHRTREISFPGSTAREAWSFTVLVRILELVHEALVNNVVTTKRDMYYKAPDLFLKQRVVDRYVDDIACTFGIERGCLNVEAAAKGLIAGPLRIKRKDGSVVDCTLENEGILIPGTREIASLDLKETYWILVIEKEATFRSLATRRFWDNPRVGKGILLTAKGYPDISTRTFLHLMSQSRSANQPEGSTKIYGLMDFDPDGLSILSTYKYGSVALAHENAQLTVRTIQWLGVRSLDLEKGHADDGQELLSLTARDRGKALRMLESEVIAEEAEWKRELQTMLFMNIKAEIQLMSGFGRVGLEQWIENRLSELAR